MYSHVLFLSFKQTCFGVILFQSNMFWKENSSVYWFEPNFILRVQEEFFKTPWTSSDWRPRWWCCDALAIQVTTDLIWYMTNLTRFCTLHGTIFIEIANDSIFYVYLYEYNWLCSHFSFYDENENVVEMKKQKVR